MLELQTFLAPVIFSPASLPLTTAWSWCSTCSHILIKTKAFLLIASSSYSASAQGGVIKGGRVSSYEYVGEGFQLRVDLRVKRCEGANVNNLLTHLESSVDGINFQFTSPGKLQVRLDTNLREIFRFLNIFLELS